MEDGTFSNISKMHLHIQLRNTRYIWLDYNISGSPRCQGGAIKLSYSNINMHRSMTALFGPVHYLEFRSGADLCSSVQTAPLLDASAIRSCDQLDQHRSNTIIHCTYLHTTHTKFISIENTWEALTDPMHSISLVFFDIIWLLKTIFYES